VNGFTVGELRFPAGYVQAPFEPDLPYLAVVIGGALEKSFGGGLPLREGVALTMPVGATHGARFGPDGARIVIVKARGRATGLHFDRLRRLRGLGLLARRLSSELRASDAAAPLAAEGIALELLAAAARESAPPERAPWLNDAEELLRARHGECVRLGEGRPRARRPGGPDCASVPRAPWRVGRRVRPPCPDRVGRRANRWRRQAARRDRG